MHRRIRDEDSAAHSVRNSVRTARPAEINALLLLATAVPWLGLAALWACTAPRLLGEGKVAGVLAGTALGAAALLLSAVLAIRAHRMLSRRLAALRVSARELAERGLPYAASLMANGLPVDIADVVPEPQLGDDELGQTAQEIAASQRATLELAIRQAESRENVRQIFLKLSQRSQHLIHRQVALLDAMERSHEDPDLLQELFAIDHLSTRLRRHAENLVILGGALPPRQWRHGVPLIDVVRSAVSETEEYTRVEVENLPRNAVLGRAVADIVHLLAELLENGCSFSPPHTQVTITGEEVSHGLVLDIEDRGPGMPDEQYRWINTRLANASSFDNAPTGEDGRLGIFVVGRLAHRHGVNVELRRSPYGGTRVIVLLPKELIDADLAVSAPGGGAPSAPAAARPSSGSHAIAAPGDMFTAVNLEANTEADAAADAAVPTAHRAAYEAATDYRAATDRVAVAIPAQSTASPDSASAGGQRERRMLPKRVKRASLAAQLRESVAAEEALGSQGAPPSPYLRREVPPGGRGITATPSAAAPDTPPPSPESSRDRMASIQRATRLARDNEPLGNDDDTRDNTRDSAHDSAHDADSGGGDSPAPAPED